MPRYKPPIRAGKEGTLIVDLSIDERDFLVRICRELLGHLASDDPSLSRLFPAVYFDPAKESEYQGYMRQELSDGRAAAINELITTAHDSVLSLDSANCWLRSLNDLRLLLGTQLGISEDNHPEFDPDDPSTRPVAIYGLLSEWVGLLVEALMDHDDLFGEDLDDDDADDEDEDHEDDEDADLDSDRDSDSEGDAGFSMDFIVPNDLSGLQLHDEPGRSVDKPQHEPSTRPIRSTVDRDREIARRLSVANLRSTSGRRLVLDALANEANPLSVTELQERVRDKIPLSSLYRIIADLLNARVLRKLEFEEGFARYEFDEDLADHHHHLVCTTCGMVVDVPLHNLEGQLSVAANEIVEATGFVAAAHRLDFFGTCRGCINKRT